MNELDFAIKDVEIGEYKLKPQYIKRFLADSSNEYLVGRTFSPVDYRVFINEIDETGDGIATALNGLDFISIVRDDLYMFVYMGY